MYDMPTYHIQADYQQWNQWFFTNSKVSQKSIPLWVKPIYIQEELPVLDPDQVSCQHLLVDIQIDIESQMEYQHRVTKILNSSGISDFSILGFNFYPAFQELILHGCTIYRDGISIQKLNMDQVRIVQMEKELKSNIYNEDFMALLFLEDIREGDILDYSYSLKDTSKYLEKPYANIFPLQEDLLIENYFLRILKPKDRFFFLRHNLPDWDQYFNETEEEFYWTISPNPSVQRENNQPPALEQQAFVEISEFSNWNELVLLEFPNFIISPEFSQDPEVISLVDSWRADSISMNDTILKAIRFVQDEIHYLGLEIGIHKWKPHDPLLSLKRRFGDCKDKTQLLRAFLDILEVPSYACLVNSKLCGSIATRLPSGFSFNHVIAQIELSDRIIFIDPTRTHQGGSLFEQMVTDFKFGLTISQDIQDLTPIASPSVEREIESNTTFIIGSEEEIAMTVESYFYGEEANSFRNELTCRGLNNLSDSYRTFYKRKFGALESTAPIQIRDDRDSNTIYIFESYRLHDPWDFKSRDEKKMSCFPSFLNFLTQAIPTKRNTPLALPSPRKVVETISIIGMDVKPYSKKVSHKAFDFSCNYIYEGEDKGRIEYELTTHLDSLQPEDLQSLSQKLNIAKRAANFEIAVPLELED